mmetsp:Transcript_28753/g.72792  ORF Transcript_28753/g.72792 Transcript_28753/m.72792 type:complete len:356 (+) Transcript_28753:334-1401(+)
MVKLSLANAWPCIWRIVSAKVSMLTSSPPSMSRTRFQTCICSRAETPRSKNFSAQRSLLAIAVMNSSSDNRPLPSVSISRKMSQSSSRSFVACVLFLYALSSSSSADLLKAFLTMTAVMRFMKISVRTKMMDPKATMARPDFFRTGRAMADQPSRQATWNTVTIAIGTFGKYFWATSSSVSLMAFPPIRYTQKTAKMYVMMVKSTRLQTSVRLTSETPRIISQKLSIMGSLLRIFTRRKRRSARRQANALTTSVLVLVISHRGTTPVTITTMRSMTLPNDVSQSQLSTTMRSSSSTRKTPTKALSMFSMSPPSLPVPSLDVWMPMVIALMVTMMPKMISNCADFTSRYNRGNLCT